LLLLNAFTLPMLRHLRHQTTALLLCLLLSLGLTWAYLGSLYVRSQQTYVPAAQVAYHQAMPADSALLSPSIAPR
jgi:hypothetical protein